MSIKRDEKKVMLKGKDIFDTMFINTKNIYKSIAKDGVLGDVHKFFKSGSYIFNAFLSGSTFKGYPGGKITALAGEKGVGKTFLILQAIKEFLDANPSGAVFFYESESAITKKMLVSRGIDVNRVYFFPVSTVEDWRNQQTQHLHAYNETNYAAKQAHAKLMIAYQKDNAKATKHNNSKAVKDGKKDKLPIKKIIEFEVERPLMMVLDSVGNLSVEAELNNALEDKNKQVMSIQRLTKSACRLITQKLSPFQVPMIMSSHVYVKMDGSGNFVMSGGSGPQFTASIIVFLTKKPIWCEKTKSYIGNIVTCILDKGRFTKEKIRCSIHIDFKTGLSLYYGLVKPGVDIGAIEQGGSWFTAINGFKTQGEGKLYGEDAPKIFDETYLKKIDEWAQEHYCYGSDTEIPYDDSVMDELEPDPVQNQDAESNIDNI